MARTTSRGFTLIEILAVVAILALVAAFVVPNMGGFRARALRAEAQQIAAQLELARQRAIVTGVPHRLWLELDQAEYRLEWLAEDPEDGERLAAAERGVRPARQHPALALGAARARARVPPDPGQLRQPPGGGGAVLLRGGRDAAGPDRRAARSRSSSRATAAPTTPRSTSRTPRAITSRSTSTRSTSACGSAMTCRSERQGAASRCSR